MKECAAYGCEAKVLTEFCGDHRPHAEYLRLENTLRDELRTSNAQHEKAQQQSETATAIVETQRRELARLKVVERNHEALKRRKMHQLLRAAEAHIAALEQAVAPWADMDLDSAPDPNKWGLSRDSRSKARGLMNNVWR